MQSYVNLANQLAPRLAAAETLEEMWAVKAAFDTEFAQLYKAEQAAARKAAEIAEAEKEAAEAQAKLAALKGE